MRLKNRKPLLCLAVLLALLVTVVSGSVVSWALGGTNPPPDPYSGTSLQGWEIVEAQLPTIIGDYDNSPSSIPGASDTDYSEDWYPVAVWGTDPSDGRMALYNQDYLNGLSETDPAASMLFTALDSEYTASGGTMQCFTPESGSNPSIWELFNMTDSGYVAVHQSGGAGPDWMYTGNSKEGNDSVYNMPNGQEDPQQLSSAFIEGLYNQNTYLINPAAGTPDAGTGMAPGWYGQFAFLPPDISISMPPINAGQPLPAGQVVNSYVTVTSQSMETWSGNNVYVYLCDSAGNILQTLTTQGVTIGAVGSANNSVQVPFSFTMPSNGAEILAAVNMTFTGTDVVSSFNGAHGTILFNGAIEPGSGEVSSVSTNEDLNWDNNYTISSIPTAQSSGGTTPALVVTPPTATVPVGGQQQYIATYYPNGQSGGNGTNVTQQASWYSGNTGIATVIVTGSSGGLATGMSQGTTGITAYYSGLGGCCKRTS